jgi:hypothetical protein
LRSFVACFVDGPLDGALGDFLFRRPVPGLVVGGGLRAARMTRPSVSVIGLPLRSRGDDLDDLDDSGRNRASPPDPAPRHPPAAAAVQPATLPHRHEVIEIRSKLAGPDLALIGDADDNHPTSRARQSPRQRLCRAAGRRHRDDRCVALTSRQPRVLSCR